MAVPAAVAAAAEVVGQVIDIIVKYYQILDSLRAAGEKPLGPETQMIMHMHDMKG